MKLNRAFAGAASILIPIGVAHAAQQPAIQQLQNSQQQQLVMPQPELHVGTNAPELYEGENADIGPQRILRVGSGGPSGRKYFDISFDTQFFYSDNANYSFAKSRIGSGIFVNTGQAEFAPDPYDFGPGKFAPALGVSSQWYNYGSISMAPLNFDAQTAFVNLRYLLGNWQFLVGGNYTRLVSQPNYSIETYNEWMPNFSVQRVVPINDSLALIVGDAVDYHFTWVPQNIRSDVNDHFDNTLYLTFNWQVTPHLAVQPSYRFQYSYYQFDTVALNKRYDYLNAFGITLIYNFNENISVRTFFNYTTKTSSDSLTPTYDELNGGLGATLDVRF